MLDLDSLTTTSKTDSESSSSEERRCGLYYQTSECYRLLKETLKYEGFDLLDVRKCSSSEQAEAVSKNNLPLLFVEVSGPLMEQAELLSSYLSHDVRVVLIGTEDSINILRNVEKLGFYYLMLPAEKQDVIVMLRSLADDLHRGRGPQQQRKALRVAVVSLKGGSGCTMVTAELAYALANQTKQQVIAVDHGYTGSNMNIMLGKRDLFRQQVGLEGIKYHTLGNFLDHAWAHSQLSRVEKRISYLGFELKLSEEEDLEITAAENLRLYTSNVLDNLKRDANFTVEDFSASAKFYPHPHWLCPLVDCLVLVVQPTLSGLHETRAFLEQFHVSNAKNEDHSRLVVVLNHCRPKGSIDCQAVEQYLQHKVDVEFPFASNCEEWLIAGKRFTDQQHKLSAPFANLSRIILGKNPQKPSLLSRLLKR
ncbi:AAA family ATPase [Spongorhabdus nitratireducens]